MTSGFVTKAQWEEGRHLYELFPLMVDVVPECKRGVVEYRHCQWSRKEAMVQAYLRNEIRSEHPTCQMDIDGVGWMFDTLHERWMNRTAAMCARGDVLIGGLGMGMILWPILKKENVRSVTVLENNPDVAALILPTLASAEGIGKLRVVEADARQWKPEADDLYDYIWLDCVPANGFGHQMMHIHSGWIDRFRPFHRTGGKDGYLDVDHWGYQENFLWMLHGNRPQNKWPREDRRLYPIGPADSETIAHASTLIDDLSDKIGVTMPDVFDVSSMAVDA